MRKTTHRAPFLGRYFPQFTLFILLPFVVIVLVMALGGISLHQQAMRNLANQQDLRTLRLVANSLADQVNRRQEALQAFGNQLQEGTDPKAVFASDNTLAGLFDGGVAIYDRKATLLAATSNYTLDAIGAFDIQMILAALPDQAQTPVGPATKPLSLPNLPPLLVMTGRLTPDIEIFGVNSLDQLVQSVVNPAFSPADSAVYLLDSSGKVLYQNTAPSSSGSLQETPSFSQVLPNQSGMGLEPAIEKDENLIYTPVPGFEWGLALQDLGQNLADPYLNTPLNAPLALIPIGVLALIALLFGASQVTGPLRRLEHQASASAWQDGQKLSKPVGGISEIRNLQAALQTMVEQDQIDQANLQEFLQAATAVQAHLRLAAALRDLTKRVELSTELPVHFDSSGMAYAIPLEQELYMYTAARAALENAAQDSQASQAWVSLAYSPSSAELQVKDDGKPAMPGSAPTGGRVDWTTLADQAAACGASLSVKPAEGKGTLVQVVIPKSVPLDRPVPESR